MAMKKFIPVDDHDGGDVAHPQQKTHAQRTHFRSVLFSFCSPQGSMIV
jgi:hypothetical protein